MAFINTLSTPHALNTIEVLKAIPPWVGALCAVFGLRTWHYQLHYRANYDLARKLLLAAYRYRELLHHARRPMRYRDDPPSSSKEDKQGILYREWMDDNNRICSAKAELETILLETEVVLGRELRSKLKQLYDCYWDLSNAKADEIRSVSADDGHPLRSREERDQRALILHAKPLGNDEFGNRIEHSLDNLEEYIRPMMSRKTEPKLWRRSLELIRRPLRM
jgi:hypothetical protein